MKSKINKSTNKTKKLIGGKFLGQGSYGCVITPAISCNKKRNSNKNTISKVSKIILKPDKYVNEEMNVSEQIKKLDKKGKYFITFDDSCNLKQIPSDRSNIVSSRFYRKSNHIVLDKKKKLDKYYCPVDLSENPINIIMPYGGIDMFDLTYNNDNNDKNNFKTILNKTVLENIRECFKNLVEGLYILHSNNIVVRDIKEENIIANLSIINKTTKKYNATLKYIDFGLSEILTKSFTSNRKNILPSGTEIYISPEIFITDEINNNNGYYENNELLYNLIYFLKKNTYDFIYEDLKEYNILKDFKQTIINLFNKIAKQNENNNEILDNYFGRGKLKYNGYLQKADIFALGLTIYHFLVENKIDVKKNRILYDLLINMIQLNPEKRFNVLECLKHPYFS